MARMYLPETAASTQDSVVHCVTCGSVIEHLAVTSSLQYCCCHDLHPHADADQLHWSPANIGKLLTRHGHCVQY